MRLTFTVPVLAAFALAACGSDADAPETLSSEDVAAAVSEIEAPQPGLYASRQELIELNVPGAPESMLAQMRAAFAEGAQEESTVCVTEATPEEMRNEMLRGMAESQCTVSRFDVSDGQIDGAMECPAGGGVSGNVTLTGTMAGDGANMVMGFAMPMPTGEATIRMRVVTERVGDCN